MENINMEKVIQVFQKGNADTVAELRKIAVNINNEVATANQTITALQSCIAKADETIKIFQFNYNERLMTNTKLQNEVNALKETLKDINSKIILSTDNQNKTGRPSLTDEEIDRIKGLLSEGYSMRQTAKEVGHSPTTVSKYSNLSDVYGGDEE